MASRKQAFQLFPVGTSVGREFANIEGQFKVFKTTVFDYSDPSWRVEYPDGDWEELTRREKIRPLEWHLAHRLPLDTVGPLP